MSEHTATLDSINVRFAKTLSRRASLIAFGGTVVAAGAKPAPVSAGKVAKKVKKTCKRQIGRCQTSVAAFCTAGPEGCEDALAVCCAFFQNCKAAAAYECLIDAMLALDSSEPT